MKAPFYLIVKKNGSTRTMKTKPDLKWDEISIHINLELPDNLFKKPTLSAEIKLSDKECPGFELTPEVRDNIKDAVKQHTGVELKITITPEENKK